MARQYAYACKAETLLGWDSGELCGDEMVIITKRSAHLCFLKRRAPRDENSSQQRGRNGENGGKGEKGRRGASKGGRVHPSFSSHVSVRESKTSLFQLSHSRARRVPSVFKLFLDHLLCEHILISYLTKPPVFPACRRVGTRKRDIEVDICMVLRGFEGARRFVIMDTRMMMNW